MERSFNAQPGMQATAEEFAHYRLLNQSASSRSSPLPAATSSHQRPMLGVGMMNTNVNMGMSYPMLNRPMFRPMYSHVQRQPQQEHSEAKGKGKEKVVELDDSKWEEQFAKMELETTREQQEKADDDPQLETDEAFLKRMDEIDQKLTSETNYGDFESIWRGIQAGGQGKSTTEGADDFRVTDWAGELNGWDDIANPQFGSPFQKEEYLFDENNLFEDVENPFEEGVRIMEAGGNLSLAALAFEAAVKRNPEHVEAWVYLGSAQAQNEKETAAIRALEHALEHDPNNLAALMGLAVSYINEGYDSTAYRTLERWLSVKYPNILAPADVSKPADVGFTDRALLHERVTDLFIKAAQQSPSGAQMDPDVQVGLGVLFYGAEDFDKAVDCFRSALDSSELGISNQSSQVHLLWNRLGATLANGGRSEEAIAAYEKALTLRPNFVRARYNLGVSCINMGCLEEAAGHLLLALAMHVDVERKGRERAREILGRGRPGGKDSVTDAELDAMTTHNRSTTLYDTLRRVFTQMGRRDLAQRVVVGVDPESFRVEFDF